MVAEDVDVGAAEVVSEDENVASAEVVGEDSVVISTEVFVENIDEQLKRLTKTVVFQDIDMELNGLSSDLNMIMRDIENPIGEADQPREIRLIQSEPIALEINLTEQLEISRFRCACHLLNNVLKAATVNQKYLPEFIKKLSTFASSIRNSISLSQMFSKANCRPKTENTTRWFSQFMVLQWAYRGNKKQLFGDLNCPVDLNQVEIYLQILAPAYDLNLIFQRSDSSICEVLPNILNLKLQWSRMDVEDSHASELLYFLTHFLMEKFKFEFESPIYKVY